MSSNNSATSGDERIETQGLVRGTVATSRETLPPVTLRNGSGPGITNDTINGTMTVELVDNCNPIFNAANGKKAAENDTDSSEDRIDTAV